MKILKIVSIFLFLCTLVFVLYLKGNESEIARPTFSNELEKPSAIPKFTAATNVSPNLTLGYCPTFESIALDIAAGNNFKTIRFESAADVLSALNSGTVEYALIGRIAKKVSLPATAGDWQMRG